MFTGLSLDQAPPFKAPLKFFLTAPLSAMIASLVIIFGEPIIHHSPSTVGVIHLFTIGFMVMIIFGALQQMLPVVAGAVIPRALLVANITYIFLLIGIISFVLGFYFYIPSFLFISAISLFLGVLFFSTICIYQLLKVRPKSIIVQGILISLLFFLGGLLLGVHLEISHALENIKESHQLFTHYHYSFVSIGFVFLLIAAITFQVVPMFWVTKPFNKKIQYFIIYGTTFIVLFFPSTPLVFVMMIIFGSYTFDILKSRKRKLQDISINYYFTSVVFLILSGLYFILAYFIDLPITTSAVLFGLGFVGSIMLGMLYKIIPFLVWFHLSSQGKFDIPTMRDMIQISYMKRQYYLHLLGTIFLSIGLGLDLLIVIQIAGVLLFCSFFYFLMNLINASKIFFSSI